MCGQCCWVWEAQRGQVPPARKGKAGWGHLAGAWETDGFMGPSEARKLNLSGVGGGALQFMMDLHREQPPGLGGRAGAQGQAQHPV